MRLTVIRISQRNLLHLCLNSLKLFVKFWLTNISTKHRPDATRTIRLSKSVSLKNVPMSHLSYAGLRIVNVGISINTAISRTLNHSSQNWKVQGSTDTLQVPWSKRQLIYWIRSLTKCVKLRTRF